MVTETAEAITGAGRRIVGAVETVAYAGVAGAAKGWRVLVGGMSAVGGQNL